jgi:hypothetical protein
MFVEGLWRTVKDEDVRSRAYESISAAKAGIWHVLRILQRAPSALVLVA